MKMKYYIAIVNPNADERLWKKLKTNLNLSGYSYVMYFDESIDYLKLNEVSKEVFEEMKYLEN